MLLTSREPMRLSVEHVMAADPMVVDDAVSLFATRATAVHPSFVLTADSRRAVEQIRPAWMGCRLPSSWRQRE